MGREHQQMSRSRGLTLIETTVAVALLAIVSVSIAMGVSGYSVHVSNRATAEHISTLRTASARYLNANPAAVAAVATPTTPAVITTAQLAAGNFLPSGFDPVNAYGQNAELRVLEPTPGRLSSLLVTTGGEAIDGNDLRKIAAEVGGMGGYIGVGDPTIAKGTGGQWSLPVASFGANPGAGHLAINLAMAANTECTILPPIITTTGCPVGFTGTRTFANTSSCPNQTGVVQWTGPVLTGSTCAPTAAPS